MSGSISATTLAYISAGTALASGAVGAYGAISSGGATAAADRYNAEVAANNAKILEQNAIWKGREGEANAAKQEQKTRQAVGAMKAAQAANGVDVNTGSAVDVRSSAAELGQLDAINIRANASRAAYGDITSAYNARAQSELDKFSADNAETAGYIGAGSTILGAAGKAGMAGVFSSSGTSGGTVGEGFANAWDNQ